MVYTIVASRVAEKLNDLMKLKVNFTQIIFSPCRPNWPRTGPHNPIYRNGCPHPTPKTHTPTPPAQDTHDRPPAKTNTHQRRRWGQKHPNQLKKNEKKLRKTEKQ